MGTTVLKIKQKINKPASNGTNGQFLKTDGQGGVSWATVVTDGSITRAKLATAVTTELDGYSSDISEIQSDIETIEGDIETIEGNVETIDGQIETIDGQIETIDGQISTIDGQITTINNDITTIQGNISAIGGDIDGLEEDIGDINASISDVNDSIQDIKDDVDAIDGRVDTVEGNITTINGSLQTINGDISTLQGSVNTINGNITTISGNITTLSGRVNTAEGNITTLGGSVTTINDNLETIGGRIGGIEDDIDDIQEDIQTIEGNISTINDAVEDLGDDIESVQGDITTLQGDISDINDDIDAVEGTITTIEGNITTINSDVSSLSDVVDDKASAIHNQTGLKNSFFASELAQYNKFSVHCNAIGYDTIYTASGEDIYPETSVYTSTYFEKDVGNYVIVNGTITSSQTFTPYLSGIDEYSPEKQLSAGTVVNLAVCASGTSGTSLSNNNKVTFYFLRSDSTQIASKDVSLPSIGGISTDTYSVTESVAYVKVVVTLAGGTFEDYKISWSGIIGSPYSSIQGGQTVSFTKEEVGNNGFSIIPPKCYVDYISDTKQYVDNHVPSGVLTASDLIYLSPEMYGAVGDQVTDDTTALQTCINDAILHRKPVRCCGTYKTTSSLTINNLSNSYHLDLYIEDLYFNGSGSSIIIYGQNMNIKIGRIVALSSGLSCISINASDYETSNIKITADALMSYSTCIQLVVTGSGVIKDIIFDVHEISVQTNNVPAITSSGDVKNISLYNCNFASCADYAFYGKTISFFNCIFGSDCAGGAYSNSVVMQNCKAAEMLATGAKLFKAQDPIEAVTVIAMDDDVYYDSIDLSEIIADGGGDADASVYNSITGVVRNDIIIGRDGEDLYKYGLYKLGKEMILHGSDKICIPKYKSLYHVTETDFDLRDSANGEGGVWTLTTRPFYPTKFIIDVDECEIHLAPSYCAEGYSEFIVDMSTYKATIYDRRSNILFDPDDYQTGVYKFTAIVDDTQDDTHQTDHSGQDVYPINSGYCDVWEIEQLS